MASRRRFDRALWGFVKRTYDRAPHVPRSERSLSSIDPLSADPPGRGGLYRTDCALSDLRPGECGTILRLNAGFCGRLRLLEMGLTPGVHVRMVRAAAFGGPVDIEVRNYQLSLRRDEASAVWLGESEDESVL